MLKESGPRLYSEVGRTFLEKREAGRVTSLKLVPPRNNALLHSKGMVGCRASAVFCVSTRAAAQPKTT